MSLSRQKPDPFSKVSTLLEVHEIYNQNSIGYKLTPLRPNDIGEVPYNRLIHHIDYLDKLSECIAVDRAVVDLIRIKQHPFGHDTLVRQEVTLLLMDGGGNSISVKIWVIPIFFEGVMVYHLYAADDENLDHLRRLRNPAKPGNYDITSL
jgi:hypothetical protein